MVAPPMAAVTFSHQFLAGDEQLVRAITSDVLTAAALRSVSSDSSTGTDIEATASDDKVESYNRILQLHTTHAIHRNHNSNYRHLHYPVFCCIFAWRVSCSVNLFNYQSICDPRVFNHEN